VRNGFVVHSEDGLDEISSLALTHAAALSPDGIKGLVIDPKELLNDISLCKGTLAGGDKTENARILTDILSGRDRTAKRGAVLLNAAAIICAAGLGDSIKACIPLAEQSIDSGAAMDKLRSIGA
jgi:anthranilate phosphoribosyltransferase